MSNSLIGFCEPANCSHECDCDCHRPGKIKHDKLTVACCISCGLCGRKIRIGSELEHNETCHKPILKKMPHPEIPKKYQAE